MDSLKKFAAHWWYGLLVALLAGLDPFILIVPTDALLVTAVLARPRVWLLTALEVVAGSSCGATAFAWLASAHGESFISFFAPGLLSGPGWTETAAFLSRHSVAGLALIAVGPLPLQPAVAIVGLAHVSPASVLGSLLVGRALKYVVIGWVTTRFPALLLRHAACRQKKHGEDDRR